MDVLPVVKYFTSSRCIVVIYVVCMSAGCYPDRLWHEYCKRSFQRFLAQCYKATSFRLILTTPQNVDDSFDFEGYYLFISLLRSPWRLCCRTSCWRNIACRHLLLCLIFIIAPCTSFSQVWQYLRICHVWRRHGYAYMYVNVCNIKWLRKYVC